MFQQLRKIDSFGATFSLKYKSENSFKTSFGGLLSIITYIILLYYTCEQLIKLVKGHNPQITLE